MQPEELTESGPAQELVSRLVDGELQGAELRQALDLLRSDAQARSRWQGYHQIGEVLRHGHQAATGPQDEVFVVRLRERLSREPVAPHPSLDLVRTPQDSANDGVWRWRLVTGLCFFAAVGLLAWQLAVPGAEPAVTQIAGVGGPSPAFEPTAAEAGVMVRDPRLDQLIAAHQQQGGNSALQMPGGFLRNATFERQGR
ncbi:MAG: sigma-E factor negative regulatory protein [Curvibacter sp.]|jgi:sigma-E factor negative regulatory protein RseA|nr:sigma-E factor negative regulatory protein [Curvibacter sp.]